MPVHRSVWLPALAVAALASTVAGPGEAREACRVGGLVLLLHGSAGRPEGRRADARALRSGRRRRRRRHGGAAEGDRRRAGGDGGGRRPGSRGPLSRLGNRLRLAGHPGDRLRPAAAGARAGRPHGRLLRSRDPALHGLLRRPPAEGRDRAARREPRNVLLRAQQRRPRDRRRQPRRGGRARAVRAALLHVARGVPHRVGARRGPRGRQRRRGRALRRRRVRHLDGHAVAGLAVHAARRPLRGPAPRGHPRAGGRPHADPPAVPRPADRDRDRGRHSPTTST